MELDATTRLSALSHPQRLAVFRLLMRRYPDAVPAGEIAHALALKPSTTSVYLSALSDAALITQTRAGTSLRYRAQTDTAAELIAFLVTECCGGRPDLCPPLPVFRSPRPRWNVLFLCTGNSARSIFAESLLRTLAGDRFAAFSAGTDPATGLNPLAVEMLRARTHDTTHLRAKPAAEFRAANAPQMDFVFTVCDRAANEECPAWDGQPISGHWGVPDPARATGTLAERRLAFQEAYGALHNRISAFAALPLATLERRALQTAIDEIGACDPKGSFP